MRFITPLLLGIALAGNASQTLAQRRYAPRTAATQWSISYNTHDNVDNFLEHAPILFTTSLNLAGVEGRSDTKRYLATGAMSYAIAAGLVKSLKHTIGETRPDGSDNNSFPSGHAALAFTAATILHKEYGQTRSPWYSVAGYGMAATTGVMRIMHNRHWTGDVMAGAALGILSTELAYGLSSIIFKKKGLVRDNIDLAIDADQHPSFVGISMGAGLGFESLTLASEHLTPIEIKTGTATAAAVEGAYFFNRHIGVGGRFRTVTAPMNNGEDVLSALSPNTTSNLRLRIESNQLTELTFDAGVYFNLPLSNRFALGSKLLIGHSMTQGIEINARTETSGDNNWSYLNIDGTNAMTCGTGLSATYACSDAFAWRAFVDYDFTRKTYTMDYHPDYNNQSVHSWSAPKHRTNRLVIGAAFIISL